jgi:uncharacterized protein GlcG (DUF336 family)
MTPGLRGALAVAIAAGVASCGGGGSGSSSPAIVDTSALLTEDNVRAIISQAVGEAGARGAKARVAVVDRTGKVLAVFAMDGAVENMTLTSGLGVTGGLDGVTGKPIADLAVITKAITAAYLSSGGNAFSTRTASQIVQDHFNPRESQQPSGPLYGVQFSQLVCSDVTQAAGHGGPQPSPLGLAADPGGLPLYKNGTLVGGIGVEIDGVYTLDLDIDDIDNSVEEQVAVAGTFGFEAPTDIRGDHITADGRSFRFTDNESLVADASHPPAFAALPGHLVAVPGFAAAAVIAGSRYGDPSSGIAPAPASYAGGGAWLVFDGATGINRYPIVAGTDGKLTAVEVEAILTEAIAIAKRARAQIRRPLGSFAQVSITVVDSKGEILGLVRTPDAPMFGIDVAVQKARTAMFFSLPEAGTLLRAAHPAFYLDATQPVSIGAYADALDAFLGKPGLDGSVAWTPRAVGNVHRPTFPDGIEGTPNGPLSKPMASWSPFNVGLQLDLVNNQLVKAVLGSTDKGCAGRFAFPVRPTDDPGILEVRNGIQIFPGGAPIYRGNQLVGAVGISGDGVDQDDMIAFLGLANAGKRLNSGIGNATAAMRADTLTPEGTRLRYVQCPQSPFNDSSEQNVCAGL